VAGLGGRRLKSPAAILKSGAQRERFFRDSQFIPFLFAKNISCEARFATKIPKKATIKLLICNELRI
jgi:hypothetical protein